MSSQRRKEEKRKKEARKAGIVDYTPRMISDILLQSQSEDLTMASATVLAYLDENGTSCLEHVRGFDGCAKKRCKLSHDSGQVGHLRGCNDGSELFSNTEKSISEGVNLRELDKRMFDSILFISVDGKLVFDYHYPENWQIYRRILNISATERAKDKQPLIEERDEEVDDGEGEGEGSSKSGGSPGGKRKYSVGDEKELDLLDRRMRSTSICDSVDNDNEKEAAPIENEMPLEPDPWKVFLKFATTALVDHILRLLEVKEICYLRGASSDLKNAISASHFARRELRSAISSSSDVKRKKQEKKKKKKNAFKSTNNKIDGFARGGNHA